MGGSIDRVAAADDPVRRRALATAAVFGGLAAITAIAYVLVRPDAAGPRFVEHYFMRGCSHPKWLDVLWLCAAGSVLAVPILVFTGSVRELRKRNGSGAALMLLGLSVLLWAVATHVFTAEVWSATVCD